MARITVWLFIESPDLTAEEMSAKIGLVPDSSWHIGDARGKTGKFYKTNSWCLESVSDVDESPLAVNKRIQESLDEVLGRIGNCSDRFRSLAAKHTAGIYVGVSANDNPVLELKAATISAIALLGVDLEFDLTIGN